GTAGTLSHSLARPPDGVRRLLVPGAPTYAAPPTADVTPPTVAITAPAANATVSATTAVTANASDNVGVVGVQFKLDGANLGAEEIGRASCRERVSARGSVGARRLRRSWRCGSAAR